MLKFLHRLLGFGSCPIAIGEPNSVIASPQISPDLQRRSIPKLSGMLVPHTSTLLMALANPQGLPMAHLLFSEFSILQSLSTPEHPVLWAFSSSTMSAMVILAFPPHLAWTITISRILGTLHISRFMLYSEVLARDLNLATRKTALKSKSSPLPNLPFWPICSRQHL